MTVPAAPTGLVVVPNDQAGNVTCRWTNPGGTLTGTIIQVSDSGEEDWVTHYHDAALSLRTLWEIPPTFPVDIRVAAVNASGTGAFASVYGVTLGMAAYCLGWSLVDTVTLDTQFYGITDTQEQGFDNITTWTEIQPAGVPNPRYFFSTVATEQGSFDFKFPPSIRLQDGTPLTSLDSILATKGMENRHNDLLFRDVYKNALYVKAMSVKPRSSKGRWMRVTFDLKKVAAPTYPLTS